jgi:hypothetical protein
MILIDYALVRYYALIKIRLFFVHFLTTDQEHNSNIQLCEADIFQLC